MVKKDIKESIVTIYINRIYIHFQRLNYIETFNLTILGLGQFYVEYSPKILLETCEWIQN